VAHILAPKHEWHRVVSLSGDLIQDYRAIRPYIEYVIRTGQPKVTRMTK
jgi:hypothetical protein